MYLHQLFDYFFVSVLPPSYLFSNGAPSCISSAKSSEKYMKKSVVYIIIVLMLAAPPDVPEITGYSNESIISVHVGSAITLVCRADHGDPPYRLTWNNGTHEIRDGSRSDIHVTKMGNFWRNSFNVFLTILLTIPYIMVF